MKLSFQERRLLINQPFVSNKGAKPPRVANIFVEIESDEFTGHGIAVPAADYGMTTDSLLEALGAFAPVVARADKFGLQAVISTLVSMRPGQPSAIAAVDMALHDILGQRAGLAVFQLLGLGGLPLPPTGATLGIMTAEDAAQKARELADWPLLKIKLGTNPDYEVVSAVRGAFRGSLYVDGNGAWEPDEAVTVSRELADRGVDLLEQPIAPGSPARLRYVKERSPLPVIADEDCIGPETLLRLRDCVDGINIKLLKCGGICRAQRMIAIARECGLRIMLGCKIESSLGVTAMAHLAPLADWSDLNGHLLLAEDPYAGVTLSLGKLTVPVQPGLGVRPVGLGEACL